MRILLSLSLSLFLLSCTTAQSGTEVYLFDLSSDGGSWTLLNPQNISQNVGYDNQPSFSPDGLTLYFASNRDGETDVVAFDIETGNKTWLTNTESRSEYSPTITPDGEHISFITLSSDGIQEFRKIHVNSGEEILIENDPIIGYFVWIDKISYLCFVLATEAQPPTLQIHNTETGEKTILGENPGRSFHKVPGAKAVSYILSKDNLTNIYAYYSETGSSDLISSTLENSQDMVWLPTGEIIMSSDSALLMSSNGEWNVWSDVSSFGLTGITRMAVHPDGTKMAIVVEE